jgi:hypothetical protein
VGEIKAHKEKRNAYGVLVEKCEGKSPLGRPRHRENNKHLSA